MGYVYVSELVREKVGSRYVSAYQPPSLSHALHILIEPLYSLVGAVKGILLYCCYCLPSYFSQVSLSLYQLNGFLDLSYGLAVWTQQLDSSLIN